MNIIKSLLLCLLLPISLSAKQPSAPPTPVESMKVQQSPIIHGVVSTGELKANRSITLKAEISGKVMNLNISEGKPVEQGTILIELDDAVAKATLNQMMAKHEFSLLKYNRFHTLAKSGTGSTSEKDEALATLRFDTANLDLAKAQFEKTKLKAPFAGILGLRQVDVGDYIDPGQALVNLDDISSLLVDFSIPEKYLSQLKEGQAIEITLEALPNQTYEGTIYAIAPQVDSVTRAIQARATLPNPHNNLRPGLFAKIKVVFEKNEQAMTVPEQSVFNLQEKSFVYRVIDNKAVLTEVTAGVRENGQVEILKGLSPQDTIVKTGRMRLFDGAAVVEVKPK